MYSDYYLPEFPSKLMSNPVLSTACEKERRCRAESSPPLLFTKWISPERWTIEPITWYTNTYNVGSVNQNVSLKSTLHVVWKETVHRNNCIDYPATNTCVHWKTWIVLLAGHCHYFLPVHWFHWSSHTQTMRWQHHWAQSSLWICYGYWVKESIRKVSKVL